VNLPWPAGTQGSDIELPFIHLSAAGGFPEVLIFQGLAESHHPVQDGMLCAFQKAIWITAERETHIGTLK